MLTTAVWFTYHRLDSFKFNKSLDLADVGGIGLLVILYEI
jgi:hypothetical protein